MIRHWRQSTFLLLALFALVACSGAAPEVESALVEVPSTTPIPPTSSPPPSATPFPTETASLTPTPQPSPTATSEPTPTPEPTVTPEAAYEPWGEWPSQEEIASVFQAENDLNKFPLRYDKYGLPWKELNGWATNPRIIDAVIADRFEISLAYDFYFNPNNPNEKVTMPLYGYDRVEERWMTFIAGSTIEGRMSPENYPIVFDFAFGNKSKPLNKWAAYLGWQEFENYRPAHYEGGIGQPDFVALLHEALGVSKEDLDHFIQTGDTSTLPRINGEIWLFANQVYGDFNN